MPGRSRRRARRPLDLCETLLACLAIAVGVLAAGCVPRTQAGELEPTLSLQHVAGGDIAYQDGIPVPTFEPQQRTTIALDGPWRIEPMTFDTDLSLTPRATSLPRIEAASGGRIDPGYDDAGWQTETVPGSLNPPPDRVETGAWARRAFFVPDGWAGKAITLKFGAVNYLADVWLNGHWLGYHEGGYTPFAFDAGPAVVPGQPNVLVLRIDNPPWGTRNDIVPWGLADWWNFGGITRSVWLEASDPVHAVRADVTPHLDGADVGIVVENRSKERAAASLVVDVLPAEATADNLLEPAASLASTPTPVVRVPIQPVDVAPGAAARVDASFLLPGARPWSPTSPALYVLRVSVDVNGATVDRLHETFGFRTVAVSPDRPAVELNGSAVTLPGVALHDQRLTADSGGTAGHLPTADEIHDQLDEARSVGAVLLRTGHTPADPITLRLADRLGLAVWEEIPLYHYTPETFGIAMGRGIPQQMLREMALRDFDRPSVLFHGLANESTGDDPRQQALAELNQIDKAIDGTRLTGQATYGFSTTDTTSAPLDVAGYTFYHGVFYGTDAASDTRAALVAIHATFPTKPVMIVEFGRWADGANGPASQLGVFDQTAPELFFWRATRRDGFVSGAVWWTLEDYATLRPQIEVEHFGMFDRAGQERPVAAAARRLFSSVPAGLDPTSIDATTPIGATGRGVGVDATAANRRFVGYVAFGLLFGLALLAAMLGLLLLRGGRGPALPSR